ncbi:MAG: diaminopimelate decarboxylase [Deltaproteobacteria bacterium]|nr:diaminopimelate decarboxylase [Deltaproteobacteria bacterium]
MDTENNLLMLGGTSAEELASQFGTPLYVYEEDVIRRQCRTLRHAFRELDPEIHYAMKANFNPAILKIILQEGLGIDAVSALEVRMALDIGFAPDMILFTGNNAAWEEVAFCLVRGVPVNVGSLEELARYGKMNPGGVVSIRVNPDVGAGHHHHVITGGPRSKFGIHYSEVDQAVSLLAKHNLTLAGLHSHIGTGILKPGQMLKAMEIILEQAARFPEISFVDFGGGFGIPYREEEEPLDLEELGQKMSRRFRAFQQDQGREVRMKLEPGRFLVAQSGTLLTRVTNLHHTPEFRFVGTDSGMNHLIRPALYGAYHRVVNATRTTGKKEDVVVAGNICESGDVFTQGKSGIEARPLTAPQVGDLLAVLDAGAYGMALASHYNLRPRPAEVMVSRGEARLIRRRETYEELTRDFIGFEPGR